MTSPRPFVLIAAFLLTTIVVAVTLGVLAAIVVAGGTLHRAMAATRISVFLEPQVGRADSEAIGGRLRALPEVLAAELQPRETALSNLVARGLPIPSAAANPLPDVWMLTLRAQAPESTLGDAVERVRQRTVAMRGVTSLQVDTAWIARLDRFDALKTGAGKPALIGVAAVGSVALLLLGFIIGRALAAQSARVGTYIGAAVGLIAVLVVLLPASWLSGTVAARHAPELAGLTTAPILSSVAVIVAALVALGTAVGSPGDRQSRFDS